MGGWSLPVTVQLEVRGTDGGCGVCLYYMARGIYS